MSSNLPPGVSDYDLPGYNEFYATLDTECPQCGHIQKDAEVLGDYDPRYGNRTATFYAECEKCEHEWEFYVTKDD